MSHLRCSSLAAALRLQTSAADGQEPLKVNTVIPALLTRQLLPALKWARGQAVFINSIARQAGARGNVVYSASK